MTYTDSSWNSASLANSIKRSQLYHSPSKSRDIRSGHQDNYYSNPEPPFSWIKTLEKSPTTQTLLFNIIMSCSVQRGSIFIWYWLEMSWIPCWSTCPALPHSPTLPSPLPNNSTWYRKEPIPLEGYPLCFEACVTNSSFHLGPGCAQNGISFSTHSYFHLSTHLKWWLYFISWYLGTLQIKRLYEHTMLR